MKAPRFGLNRFDARSVDAFAADVRRAEELGWDAARVRSEIDGFLEEGAAEGIAVDLVPA